MTERLPRVALVLLVTACLVVTLAGLRATEHIVGPTFLALVLTITVHPIRRRMVRRGMPEWLVSLVVLLSVIFLLLSVTICMAFAIGRLAALLPTYIPDVEDSLADAGAWLADRGVGADQVEAVISAFDFGNLLTVATDIFGAAIGVVSSLVFIVTLALFMAFDTGGTQRVFDRVRETKPDLVDALANFAKGTRTYMAVSAGFGLIVAVIDGVALQLMGVPGAFVWARAGVRHQLHPEHRVRDRRHPAGPDRAPRGRARSHGQRAGGLLRDQPDHPVDHPAALRRRRGRSHPDHHDAVPGLLGLGARPTRRAPRGAAQPADARAPDRGRPRRRLGHAPDLRARARSRRRPRAARELSRSPKRAVRRAWARTPLADRSP